MTAEKTISAIATIHRLRTPERIWSLKSSPSTQMGRVPMITHQPSQ